MGRRFSRFHRFGVVKTPMGLKRYEVRFFFGGNFTKIDLAFKEVIKNRSKFVYRLSVMFFTISSNICFFVKSRMGTPLDWKILIPNFFLSYDIDPRKVTIWKFVFLRSKTFLYDSLETREFLCVKTPIGIQWFEVHFRAIFTCSRESIESWLELAINQISSSLVMGNDSY